MFIIKKSNQILETLRNQNLVYRFFVIRKGVYWNIINRGEASTDN